MKEKHIAMCGLDCNSCPAFIATKNNNNSLRKKTAKEWTIRYSGKDTPPIKQEDINCVGCLSEKGLLYKNCSRCEIRKCGLVKGIKNCNECKDYKCEKLIELQKHLF